MYTVRGPSFKNANKRKGITKLGRGSRSGAGHTIKGTRNVSFTWFTAKLCHGEGCARLCEQQK